MDKVIADTIKKGMIERGDRVVAGVSGGADSVCLFFVLLKMKKILDFDFMVVHVNHQIRGEEALEDQKYVEKICRENGIFLKVVTVNVKEAAKKEKLSEEEAGRKVRYEAFGKVMREWNGNKIALAHHKDDQAETVLWNLIRGSGLRGMAGMRGKRDCFIRPLLMVTRKEIEQYLKEREIPYQTDSTNQELKYTRNKIRHKVIPYLAGELNQRVVEHISNTAQNLQEIQDYIDRAANQVWNSVVQKQDEGFELKKEPFQRQDVVIQKALLQKVLQCCNGGLKDITNEHIFILWQLFDREVGKRVYLPGKAEAVKTYTGVVIHYKKDRSKIVSSLLEAGQTQKSQKQCEVLLIIPGTAWVEEDNIKVECSIINHGEFEKNISIWEENSKKNIINSKNYCTKWFDYDKINNMVFFRNQKKGDRIQIGKNGEHKKLNRFCIDQKIPRNERGAIWLLAEGNEVVWIVGKRVSEGYRITEQTERILQVTVEFLGNVKK